MRLINTTTLDIEEFVGSHPPSYAILSHTWGDQEVSLQDWYESKNPFSNLSQKKGYVKISEFCRTAWKDGYDYAWVDTCCIDKSSSAELTESINSMFLWYKQAKVCYAYLEDFDSSASSFYFGARKCIWFARGWTLQELIAPVVVRFYDVDWCFRGTRNQNHKALEEITGIDWPVLVDPDRPGYVSPYEYSVADRMSWSASRGTTRMEDVAYCLLGLFDVSLPLIYGEGTRAFRRLQEAIIQSNNDLSILAWGMPHTTEESRHQLRLERKEREYITNSQGTDEDDEVWSDDIDTEEEVLGANIGMAPDYVSTQRETAREEIKQVQQYRKLFATSPMDFVHSKHISKTFLHYNNPEFSMTNKGLRIQARIYKGLYEGSRGYFLHLAEQELVDSFGDCGDRTTIWLKLKKIWADVYIPDSLISDATDLELSGQDTGLMNFYISHRPQEDHALRHPSHGIHIPELPHIQLKKTIPETQWDDVSRIFYEPEESDALVFAAKFEAQIPRQDNKLEFIVLFDRTVTCTGEHPLLCRVLFCKEYPRQSDWIFSNRGPGRDLLWCDLEFNMLEVLELGSDLEVEVGGTMVALRVGLESREMWTVQFDLTFETIDEEIIDEDGWFAGHDLD
ncbi:hypothetical protein SLS53_007390 [Cytospora paraplurivora]|uniref:Heterokaryon incompatibility domain-containing protein n=1 Tax=Cytospora paraplurivora TaxID=2898453 RepID=A0AAN9YDU7_9PEZI